jgi:tetratricopeptide (TPR) repeat protein
LIILIANQKDAEEAARLMGERFESLKTEGDGLFAAKDYASAIDKYSDALLIKPEDSYSKQKIAEAENAVRQQELALNKKQDEEYTKAMTAGGSALTLKNFDEALEMFQNALSIKPGDIAANTKINEVNKVVAGIEAEERNKVMLQKQAEANSYSLAISGADNYLRSKDYERAREEYNRALGIKPDESYPQSRIIEIEGLIAARDKEQSEILAKKDAYTSAINAANGFYDKKQYRQAREQYMLALQHIPGDEYATGRLTLTDQVLAGLEKQQQAEEQRLQQINGYISQADREFDGGNYKIARQNYQQAGTLDPGNAYVRQRISRIDEIERILASAGKSQPSSSAASRSASAGKLAELQFRNENERQVYLNSLRINILKALRWKIYNEEYKDTYRYIIIRKNEVKEFRRISYTKFTREEYSMNGKPITQMIFFHR